MEEKIRKYFLGALRGIDADVVAEEIAQNPDLFQTAQIIEQELIDDFANGKLSPDERELFDGNYATTGIRREKIQFAKMFFQTLPPVAKPEKASFWNALFGKFRFSSAPAVGFAALIVMAVILGFLLTRPNQKDIAEQRNAKLTAPPIKNNSDNQNLREENASNADLIRPINTNADSANNSNANPAMSPKSSTKPTPTIAPKFSPSPIVAAFTLLPGTLRSDGEQFIEIPAPAAQIRFNLTLPKDALRYKNYSITIKTLDEETIFAADKLPSPKLIVSAVKLKNQTYIIFLAGKTAANPAESIAEYAFRVRR